MEILRTLRLHSMARLFAVSVVIAFASMTTAYAGGHFTTGPSDHCHVTDGIFTTCPDLSAEWSDIQSASFFDEDNLLLSVLYVDQADLHPDKGTPESNVDTLMLMYDEVQRTTDLLPGESVHVHFMTVDSHDLELDHYDVFIDKNGLQKVLINDVEQVPMPSGVAGIAGFGTSPNNATPHVMAEFQIGLEAAGFTGVECCYSPDPAWWGSSAPGNPTPGECPGDQDCDRVPDPDDQCQDTPGLPQNNGCPTQEPCSGDQDCDGVPDPKDECPRGPGLSSSPLRSTGGNGCPERPLEPGDPVSTSAGIFTAHLDGSTTVVPQPLLPPGEEPLLCESIGRIVDFRVPPGGKYRNHGAYMRLVAQLTEALVQSQVDAGLITEEEAKELQSCVVHARAKSVVGKKK